MSVNRSVLKEVILDAKKEIERYNYVEHHTL